MATSAAPTGNLHENRCDKHDEDQLFWCVACKRYICRTCVSELDHDHKRPDILQEQSKTIKECIDRVKETDLPEVQQEIKSVDVILKQNSDACDLLLSELRSKTQKLETIKSGNNKVLNKYKTELKIRAGELKERKQMYEKALSSESDILIFDIESDSNAILPLPRTSPLNSSFNLDDLEKSLSKLAIPGFWKCDRPKCKLCWHAETRHFFESFTKVTKGLNTYNSVKRDNILHPLSCTSADVIYLITCGRCKKQYVGQTQNELHERIERHMVQSGNTAVYQHFTQPAHSFSHMKVIAIEQQLNKKRRLERETYWIQELKTLYPNGINKREK